MVPVWWEPMVLAVALKKKDYWQSPKHLYIIPDRERAKPSHLSRPLRSTPARFESAKCLRRGGSLKKKEGENRTIYLSKNRSTLFVDNSGI
jgi:hypothetical protein